MSVNNIKLLQHYFEDKPVYKAFVFGSYARGDADANSDYDILVELDYSKKIGLEFIQMQLDLSELLKKNVDLVSDKALSGYIRPFIDKEKLLVYERSVR